jgi:hypothetical protein
MSVIMGILVPGNNGILRWKSGSRVHFPVHSAKKVAVNCLPVKRVILKTSPQRREGAKIAKETTGGSYLTIHPVGQDERQVLFA